MPAAIRPRRNRPCRVRTGGDGGRGLVIRVNRLESQWGRGDLAAAAMLPIDAVLLPKVESAERVRQSLSLLEAFAAPSR
jgi:citrate lyase subunit beta/citryl-CoA lyase